VTIDLAPFCPLHCQGIGSGVLVLPEVPCADYSKEQHHLLSTSPEDLAQGRHPLLWDKRTTKDATKLATNKVQLHTICLTQTDKHLQRLDK
jgi:hypothetical protein